MGHKAARLCTRGTLRNLCACLTPHITASVLFQIQCSTTPVNAISISPTKPTLIATGGADRVRIQNESVDFLIMVSNSLSCQEVVLWDYRKLSHALYKMSSHVQMVC